MPLPFFATRANFLSRINDSILDLTHKPDISYRWDSLTVAASTLQSWASEIFDSLHALLQPASSQKPTSLNDKIYDLLTTYPTASYTTVATLLLSVIFLVYRYLMNGRSSFGYYDGRGSPFMSNLADAAPRNLSGHFEYIDADHDLYQKHRPSVARPALAVNDDYEDPSSPDRVHVRYMASVLAVDFPAYTISEEKILVEDLRKRVAKQLKADPRQVRLVYKGRDLKHNSWPLRRYHMKQNSEVAAIVTESSIDYDYPDGHSESGSDSSGHATANPRRQRPRGNSSVRHRSDENLPLKVERNGGAHLHPNGHMPSRTAERPVRHDSLRPSDRDDRGHDHGHDRGRDQEPSRQRVPSRSPAPPVSSIPPADPNSPVGKLQALTSTFHTKWLPDCTKFLLSPPSDPQARTKELLKLSEGVMSQIVLKADMIETDGNADARTVRKALVNEANRVLKQLDAQK